VADELVASESMNSLSELMTTTKRDDLSDFFACFNPRSTVWHASVKQFQPMLAEPMGG
jgi:hypothetical protein